MTVKLPSNFSVTSTDAAPRVESTRPDRRQSDRAAPVAGPLLRPNHGPNIGSRACRLLVCHEPGTSQRILPHIQYGATEPMPVTASLSRLRECARMEGLVLDPRPPAVLPVTPWPVPARAAGWPLRARRRRRASGRPSRAAACGRRRTLGTRPAARPAPAPRPSRSRCAVAHRSPCRPLCCRHGGTAPPAPPQPPAAPPSATASARARRGWACRAPAGARRPEAPRVASARASSSAPRTGRPQRPPEAKPAPARAARVPAAQTRPSVGLSSQSAWLPRS
mmetsp:Transcript_3814/g.11807  ORF Transcript_3814/g.11807 Transcript_3814/m.11807 type:complete len:279 (-) Transcript_3814:586-1422(-)